MLKFMVEMLRIIFTRSDCMEMIKNNQSNPSQNSGEGLSFLDRGIDDMEAGRELPLEDAFQMISELRDTRRSARV